MTTLLITNARLITVPTGTDDAGYVDGGWMLVDDDRIEAWQQLAEYDWPRYRFLSGEWKTDEEGNRLHYVYHFRSRSKDTGNAKITCYLHLPKNSKRKGLVYGVMVVSFMEGVMEHHFEEEIQRVAESFQILE